MRRLFFITLFSVFSEVYADPILIGIHYGQEYLRATISIEKGRYAVMSEATTLFIISEGQTVDITATSGRVNVFYGGQNYASNTRLQFDAINEGTFNIQPAGHKKNARIYTENLIAFAYNEKLQLVNEIELENYVSGVIEAESGKGHEFEYYKVQSVISRTYALNNLVRHQLEGFNICDATHCQVYHGKPTAEPFAMMASASTKDIVIVDAEINLITAAFHSNCGGRTMNAEDVWSKSLSYCQSRPDSFCLDMPHSHWEKSIPMEKWTNYVADKRTDNDFVSISPAGAELDHNRQFFVIDSVMMIPLREMREDLKLRSTSFNMTPHSDHVKLSGRGFGHGVGLCQEGAMKMAQLDFCYEDIIHFYYKDVHLIPRYMIWFFKD